RRARQAPAGRSRARGRVMAVEDKEDAPPGRKFDRKLIQRVTRFARPYRKSFLVSVVLLLVLAVASLLVPLAIKQTIDRYLPASTAAAKALREEARHSTHVAVAVTAAVLLGLGLFLSTMRFFQIRVINETGQRVIHDLRMAVFRHITTRSLR